MNPSDKDNYSEEDNRVLRKNAKPYNRHKEKNSWLEEYLEDTKEAAKEIEDWLHDREMLNNG